MRINTEKSVDVNIMTQFTNVFQITYKNVVSGFVMPIPAAMEMGREGLCVNHACKLAIRFPFSRQLLRQCNWSIIQFCL
jgi:hypothetical protein